MTHFQFTSPNAAGAKDNQAMLTAMREALREVQKVEAEVISAAPAIAQLEGEAIQSQAEHESSQMRSQAIGSIVGGTAGIISSSAEFGNQRASAPSETLVNEAQLNEDYANALEDGKTAPDQTGLHAQAEDGDTTDNARLDREDSIEQIQELENKKSEAAKDYVRNKFETDAEKCELKSGARNRQVEAENQNDAINEDKAELRRKSSEMTKEHRAELVNRFRRRADSLRARANNIDAQSQRRSNITQGFGQIGNAAGQAGGGYAAASAKMQAGVEQRQAEMSRLLAQGRQKTEDNSTTQTKSVADSLKGAVDAQRNYYSSRG